MDMGLQMWGISCQLIMTFRVLRPEVSMSSGLMVGKRGMDGSNVAYDMKSLGQHIEAVSKKTRQKNS